MANADGYVLPKPGIPKTLGILNIIFGVLLVLLGLCSIGGLVAGPAMMGIAEKAVKEAQESSEAQYKADLKAVDDRIAAAKDDEQKKAIEAERTSIETNKPKVQQMDLSAATDVFKDPTIMGFSYAEAVTGLVLHVMLLVSGIGLIRLTSWGRSMGVWWSVLQIVQILAFLAASIFVVMPISRPNTDKQIAKMEEAAKAQGAGPAEASALQMTKTMAALAVPMAVGKSFAGLVYPIILVIMLGTAGARAACLPRKPESERFNDI